MVDIFKDLLSSLQSTWLGLWGQSCFWRFSGTSWSLTSSLSHSIRCLTWAVPEPVCAHRCVRARWVDACSHSQSSSDGSEVTFKGVVWDEGTYCAYYRSLGKVGFPFKEPTCFKMNIVMAKMRLGLLWKDHIKNVKTFSELKQGLHSAGLIGMAFP